MREREHVGRAGVKSIKETDQRDRWSIDMRGMF